MTVPSKQELVAAERARRARKRAAQKASASDPAVEAWAHLGVQGADTITAVRDATRLLIADLPDPDRYAVLQNAVSAPPTSDFPSVLRAALGDLEPYRLIGNLARLGAAGVPWISELGLAKTLLLAEAWPSAETIGPLPTRLWEGTVPWRLYLAVLGHPVQLGVEEIAQELERMPLTLVDDLIDGGVLGPADRPWEHRHDPLEASYLRARLVPEKVSLDEVTDLQWPEAIARHAYLAGAAETGDAVLDMLITLHQGDRSHLFELRAALPDQQRMLLQEITAGAQVGHWPKAIAADRSLWDLLAAQWTTSILQNKRRDRPVNPSLGAFHSWRAYCAAYERILDGDIEGAVRQADAFHATEEASDRASAEINNLRAYLALRPDERRREDLERAERLLSKISGELLQVSANLALVQRRMDIRVNDRESWENPYFVMGLAHGDPDWTARWRELSRRFRDDVDALARVNEAWKRIQDAERSGATFFKVPLDDDFLRASPTRSPVLIPPLAPLPRRTVTSEDDLRIVKTLAAADLLTEFDDTVRGDHDR
jgi:hypothetical protein